MKTLNKYTMNLMWVIVFSLFVPDGFSQDTRLSRQERKGIRNAQMAQNFVILDSLLNNKRFVLEADFLKDGYGNRAYVLSSLNFIVVDGSKGVLQTGSYTGRGYNGVGGVTAKGNIGGWKIHKDFKRLTYSLEFSILTSIGHYDIFLTVTSDNRAMATISGLGPGRLTWEGHLATVDNSRIFKGQDTV
jgi:hypothetical protein